MSPMVCSFVASAALSLRCVVYALSLSDGALISTAPEQDVRQEEGYNYGLTTLNVSRGSVSKQSAQAKKTGLQNTCRRGTCVYLLIVGLSLSVESERGTVWEWNEAFQWILKKQVEALIDMGFDKKMKVNEKRDM